MNVMANNLLLILTGLIFNNYCFAESSSSNISIAQKIDDDPDLSQFRDLVMNNEFASYFLKNRPLTIFAPTNAAFQRYPQEITELQILYHMVNLPKLTSELGSSITTVAGGSPTLWVTKKSNADQNEIYINNAKIIKADYMATCNGSKQVLHVIDEVLVPVLPSKTTNTPIDSPNAFDVLFHAEKIDIGLHRLRTFRQKVNQTNKANIYKSEGKFTFFIPVEDGFKPTQRADMLDEKVIDGHIIPNYVLFTTPTPYEHHYETLAFGDNLKVTVSFTAENEQGSDKPAKVYVTSNTLNGDSKHTPGVVQADIVKANIPVKNGVIHLLQRPLMIVDMTIAQVFEMMKEEGPMYKFYETLQDSSVGRQFLNSLSHVRDATVFAPSNSAWSDRNMKNILSNENKMREIFNMHLVKDQRLSVDKIRASNLNQVPTAADKKNIYFNVLVNGSEQILTVDSAGVNATVIQADIAATNGMIHIIDKVLGVPRATVLEKLSTDEMLQDTYFLGKRQKFNKRLNDTTKKFTYFAPHDQAWKKMRITIPSTMKKLFMPDYSYHAVQILERHLVISDVPYTMEKIKQMAEESGSNEIKLPSVRDDLTIRVLESNKSFTVIWRNEQIRVIRPDVECTNGVIHVLEEPFLVEEDVKVGPTSSSCRRVSPGLYISLLFLLAMFVLQ